MHPSLDCWTAFLLGLVGSLHCAGMCGPLALALPAAGNTAPAYVLGRVAYNAGRIITYCLLGIVFGLVGYDLPDGRASAVGLHRVGGGPAAGPIRLAPSGPGATGNGRSEPAQIQHVGAVAAPLPRGSLRAWPAQRLAPLRPGLCGVRGRCCHGRRFGRRRYMAAFGAGTVPMMLAISLSGKLVPASLRLKLVKTIPVCVFFLARC